MSDSQNIQVRFERRETTHAIRGIDYVVNEWGDASRPLIVYLHGWADTGSTIQFVADELAENWRIVAPDWRGFGRTRSRAAAYWFPDYLADLHALLEIYSPGQAVRLVGHSMGANIGGLYAGTFPERVAAFVNIEGFGLKDRSPAAAPDQYREWIEAGNETQAYSSYASFAALAARLMRRDPHMDPHVAAFVAQEWAECGEDGRVVLRADPNHKLPNAVLYRRAEAEACWARIAAPVLLVSGTDSQFAERFGEATELPIPNQRSVSIDTAGHMIHFEQPAALAAEIGEFFTQTL